MNTRETYEALLAHIELPRMVKLKQQTVMPKIENPRSTAYDAVKYCPSYELLKEGQRIAITAGSREIRDIVPILQGVIMALREKGTKPFVITAMGSHGGACVEGQLSILEHFGITEKALGVPVIGNMETIEIGKTELGESVHLDKIAAQADYIIPVGKVKAHAEFRGRVESGLMKMLVIGLGNQHGACLCHKLGFPQMGDSLWRFGNTILQNANVLMGVAIIENGEHDTALIEAVEGHRIPQREPELLEYAKSLIPKIPYHPIDVLLVDEFGKNISGAGMDPNVTGRSGTIGEFYPFAEKIGVLNITKISEGNAAGIGCADAITKRMGDQINTMPMYVNSITCRDSFGYRIPVMMDTEELVLKYLIHMCIRRDATQKPYVVWIKNTSNLKEILVSEALYEEQSLSCDYIKDSEPMEITVDANGDLHVESVFE